MNEQIQAIARALRRPIKVFQAHGNAYNVGEVGHEHEEPALRLSYHRHMYGLGAHYNAVVQKQRSANETSQEEDKVTNDVG